MNAYFTRILEANFAAQRAIISTPPFFGTRAEDAKTSWYAAHDVKLFHPSWNQAYLVAVMGWIKDMGHPVDDIISGLARYTVARFLNWPAKESSPYLCAVGGSDGQPYSILESYRQTFANRNGRDWSWRGTRGYMALDRAALVAAKAAGAPGAGLALSNCEDALGVVPWSQDLLWALN